MKPNIKKADLAIVIVNYETPRFVIDCLDTLLPEIEPFDCRVVVVDNNSRDDSMVVITSWLNNQTTGNRVTLIGSKTNGGFSAGNNLGIKTVTADTYLLLNSDTLLRPGSIKTLIDTSKLCPEFGIISPRLEWETGEGQESCFRFHSPISQFCHAAQTGLFDRIFQNYIVPLPVQESRMSPQWTSFACVMIRREVFESIGLLDEGYFMYFEDVEFCWRAQRAGWKIIHEPAAHVVHLRGGSSPVKENARLKLRLPRYFYESRARYFFQTRGWLGLFAADMLWSLGGLISAARQFMGRKDKKAIDKQWRDIWINWLQPMKKYTHPTSGY